MSKELMDMLSKSLDKNEFVKKTGYENYEKIIHNIDYSIQIGLPVKLSVQGVGNELENNLKKLNEKYSSLLGHVFSWGTTDRAGNLKNRYSKNILIKGKLSQGCLMVINWIHINTKGYFFTCCEDYSQSNIYGNIKDGSIYDIVNSEKAIELRKKIYGYDLSNEDFLCRKCVNMKNYRLLELFNKVKGLTSIDVE